ncbi:transposase [Corynebacterium diphtheriae]|uniref:transposase n=1 Tax=Corynebacterium diphtheriae TaxID=1717 RepID=UPI0013C75414|nr:transposase [Corynebacterium diphtheriae]CAB0620055.1 transposase [Corynebacterium diphtheriae]
MQPNRNIIVDTIYRTAEHGDVTVIEAEPVEPHMRAAKKTINKRRKDILVYFDTQSMHSKTGRATKRGYFEGFFSALHTKSLPNRPFEQIWCEVPSFRG